MSVLIKKNTYSDSAKSFEKKMLLKKIAETSDLPTPNAHMVRMLKLLKNENVEMSKIIHEINQDQSLVAKILKMINSGYYGIRNTITSVDQAVSLLGILKTKQLVYSASVIDCFDGGDGGEWAHAYSSSVLMSDLMMNDISAEQNLPMTALMHDIGKIVLKKYSPTKYKMLKSHVVDDEMTLIEAEQQFLQTDHAEAGAYLLRCWGMEESIVVPIENHHNYNMVPAEFALETALLQFVNWVDCVAHDLKPPHYPSRDFLNSVGIEELDRNEWVSFQRSVIAEIAKNQ
ncbi:MAG: hypothetical protein A2020_14470 [Lentisphaerae bacterium GWF2_45_14]|nr:MAG: hypothetical protein A2020_14470 [Lentisphaerae bacterium GWF2_45_14]